jgi:glyoxylase-like metal-dependent hydrolase (beta-lactamase superfamily II)
VRGQLQIDVLTSGIWQTNSAVISQDGACIVTDPAYFPRELEAIAACVQERGRASAVAFTHGHWDHVMGHAICPDAPVWMHEGLAAAITAGAPHAATYLEAARDFDSRWYVQRRPIGDEQRLAIEGEDRRGGPLRALHLPGHSPDGLALLVEPLGILLVGDYLSPCEIPFLDDAAEYCATLQRLLGLLDGGARTSGAVREVLPGHGRRLSAEEAGAIARADLAYVERLLEAAARGDIAAALALELPRAAAVAGMREAHRENCAKVGLGVTKPAS